MWFVDVDSRNLGEVRTVRALAALDPVEQYGDVVSRCLPGDLDLARSSNAVAARFAGVLGASVSGGARVVALAVLEYGPRFGAASCARTR